MRKQSGNFLLQALLALTLVFAFMPFLAKRLASRDMAAQMYSAKQSIETVYNAARLFLYDPKNKEHLVMGEQTIGINELIPYGVPLGFNPVTSLDQRIEFVVVMKERSNQDGKEEVVDEVGDEFVDQKDEETLYAELESQGPIIEATVRVTPGGEHLTEYQIAELARMIGFFAKPRGKNIELKVPVDVMYTDIVLRKETSDGVGFLAELDMGGNQIERTGSIEAEKGSFDEGVFDNNLYISGQNDTTVDRLSGDIKIKGVKSKFFVFGGSQSASRGVFDDVNKEAVLTINGGADLFLKTECDQYKLGLGDNAFRFEAETLGNRVINGLSDIEATTMEATDFTSGNFISKSDDDTVPANIKWTVGGALRYRPNIGTVHLTNIPALKAEDATAEILYGTSSEDFNVDAGAGGIIASGVYSKISVLNSNMQGQGPKSSVNDLIVLDMGGMSKLPDLNILGLTGMDGCTSILADPYLYPTLWTLQKYLESNKNLMYMFNGFFEQYNSSKQNSLIMTTVCNFLSWERLERKINWQLCAMAREPQCLPVY